MAFLGRHLHMQPSEFAGLSNHQTGDLVKATRDLLKGEDDERWAMLKLILTAAAGRQVL